MVIHVKDAETDWLVRDFARRRGIGLTEAIKVAIREANVSEAEGADALLLRLQPAIDKVKAMKVSSLEDDKEFMDDMWGEQD